MAGYLYILKIDADLVKVGMTKRAFNRRYRDYPLVNILGVAQVDNAESSEVVLRGHFAKNYSRVKETEYFKCDPYSAAFEFQKVINTLSINGTTLFRKLQDHGLAPTYLYKSSKDELGLPYCEIISIILAGYSFNKGRIVRDNGSLWVPGNDIHLKKGIPVNQTKIIEMCYNIINTNNRTKSTDSQVTSTNINTIVTNTTITNTTHSEDKVTLKNISSTVTKDKLKEAVLLDMSF